MILGVDHLALSCTDLEAAAAALVRSGAEWVFTELELPNAPEKRDALRRYEPVHGVTYLRFPSGIAVELTRHAPATMDSPSCFEVYFRGPVTGEPAHGPIAGPAFADAFQSVGGAPACAWWPDFGCRVWCDRDSAAGLAIRAIGLAVPDLPAARRFWVEGLGAVVTSEGPANRWLRLGYQRPVPAWCLDLVLVPGPGPALEPCLDDAGFPCLALLSNRLDNDVQRVLGAGGRAVGHPFTLEVNGRNLRIALVRGPAGELVELLEVVRGSQGEK